MNAFEILGIEPTEDKKTIKKAYASLVKKYHPEEDMQKWQEIHEAYQRALEWAEGWNYLTKTATVPVYPSEEDTEKMQDETELNELFDNLEELSTAIKEEKNEQEKQKLEKALAVLDHMNLFPELVYEDWEELLSKEEYRHAVSQSAFLDKWSELLVKRSIDKRLYQLMDEKLKSIVQYQADSEQTVKKEGLIDPVQLTGIRIRAAYDRYREKRKKRNKIAVFTILILIEVVPFVIFKINELVSGELRRKMEMRDSINFEYNLRYGNEEWINNNKKGLNEVSEFELYVAESSLSGMEKFLVRADEEILSMVLPHTQTLEPGVLVLGEDFELRQALQEETQKKADNTENEYELVPLSLPFTNRIVVGEESIDLPKETIKFAVRTEGECDSVLLWIDPEEMGFESGCEIYCFDGEDYQKAGRIGSEDGRSAEIYFYDVLNYQVLEIPISRLGEEEYPVVLIPWD